MKNVTRKGKLMNRIYTMEKLRNHCCKTIRAWSVGGNVGRELKWGARKNTENVGTRKRGLEMTVNKSRKSTRSQFPTITLRLGLRDPREETNRAELTWEKRITQCVECLGRESVKRHGCLVQQLIAAILGFYTTSFSFAPPSFFFFPFSYDW